MIYVAACMIRGVVTAFLLAVNLVTRGGPVALVGVARFLSRGERRRKIVLKLAGLADHWVAGNNAIMERMLSTRWEVSGIEGLNRDGHYLVLSNHISWVDILVLFKVFHEKVAFLRYVLKAILIWFPIAGQGCAALDFPFMKRYSQEYLEKHPEKRGEDLATIRRSCQRYRTVPVAIANFLEGTRYTPAKHRAQKSPYRHLLRPRVGGLSFLLASLGDQLDGIIDVTIAYPGHDMTLWRFITNRVPRIVVVARKLEVPQHLLGPGVTQPGPEREELKRWVVEMWREKDALLERTT